MKRSFRLYAVMALSAVSLAGFARQCPGPWDMVKVEGNLKGNAQYAANYKVTVEVKDLSSGEIDEHDASSTVKQLPGGYSYYIHFDPEKVSSQSALEITTTVTDPKTGEVVAEKKEIQVPKDPWGKCQTIYLDPVRLPKDTTALPPGTATGVVITPTGQKPIPDAVIKFYSNWMAVVNKWGYFGITGINPGMKGDVIVPYPGGSHVRNADEYVPTWVNVPMPVDRGVNIGPIRVLTTGQWDSLRTWAHDSLAIFQYDAKGFVFGQVKNYFGYPIPDAKVSLVPPSGNVIYYDPVEWDTASHTSIRPGYHLSATYMIFNADQMPGYSGRVVAIHRITGDTVGVLESISVPNSGFVLVQADIVARDSTPPVSITDLTVVAVPMPNLHWTAPGDDGNLGTAYRYDIRYSTTPVGTDTINWWWNIAAVVDSPPSPKPAGTRESFAVAGLSPDSVYYFMIESFDEVMNRSGYSNAATGIEESRNRKILPVAFDVASNPVSGQVELSYFIMESSPVLLSVYSLSGEKLATLVNGMKPAGWSTGFWNGIDGRGKRVAAGVYLCRLETPGRTLVKKIVLVR